MADKELVIKISEEEYARIQSMDWKNGDRIYDEAERAIHYGTPLPKGHGDLIDKEKAKELVMSLRFCEALSKGNVCKLLDLLEKVIPADKGEEE